MLGPKTGNEKLAEMIKSTKNIKNEQDKLYFSSGYIASYPMIAWSPLKLFLLTTGELRNFLYSAKKQLPA